ncbi:hypothetical protein [Nocardioides sp. YIM 152315]|uniref:hypothetical protein n=1 Tax=Nocardioides sp. YIM 152315 TaxID=3031760 RepID=UPI0023D9D6CF|nr:hypothetical protein [Nocardioides sp. YIM 152315]MDF1603910.1 hypothetical protein [Nocardioides sp. YIM 152315]
MKTTTVRIAAPVRVTFDYVAEPRNRPRWQLSLRRVDVLTDGPTAVGTRWLDRTMVGAAPCLEITAMTSPSATASGASVGVWSEEGRWRGLTATLALTFVPVAAEPSATDVLVRLDFAGTGAWKLPATLLRVLALPAVRADLRRAARIIEAGGATTGLR